MRGEAEGKNEQQAKTFLSSDLQIDANVFRRDGSVALQARFHILHLFDSLISISTVRIHGKLVLPSE